MYKYSIIIPIYNTHKFVDGIVEWFLSISLENSVELVLIDDGSDTKYTNDLLINNNIQYHYISNHGVSYARNLGIEKSRGEYLLFLDSDDSYVPNIFDTLNPIIEKKQFDIICCGFNIFINNKLNKIYTYNLKNKIISGSQLLDLYFNKKIYIHLCGMVFKKSLIINNKNMFDESIFIGEDIEFFVKCINASSNSYISEQTVFNYLIRNHSAMTSSLNTKKLTVFNALENLSLIFDKSSLANDYYLFYSFHLITFLIQIFKEKPKDNTYKISCLNKLNILTKVRYGSIFKLFIHNPKIALAVLLFKITPRSIFNKFL